jgi:ABC-2 type transport system permease protein
MSLHDIWPLVRKERRQLLRSRGALLSALLFPILFLLIMPLGQMYAATLPSAAASFNTDIPAGTPVPAGLAAVADDPKALLRGLILPLFITLGGLVVPSMTATYTLIAERENRTLDLLVALPVRIGDILLAKVLVIAGAASAVTLLLFAVDAVAIVALGIGSVAYVLALLLLLLVSLAYSTASALLISLLAKDFRTANNLTGALIGPTILVCVASMIFLPGMLALWFLIGLFALLGVAALVIALRVVTFERLLS